MNETHVVFGATGALGAAVVRRLAEEGRLVRAVVRDVEHARELLPRSAGIVAGDAANPESARSACTGASVVYHCVNARYSKWTRLMPGITDNILSSTREAGARLVFPGNVYGYGRLQQVPAREDHPMAATSKKGLLRISLERKLAEAHRAGEVRLIIPRFPDFYGPNVTNPLMAPLFQAALKRGTATWPCRLDVPHDLVFIDDAAAACVLLAEAEEAFGQSWHVPGAGPITGREFIQMVFKAAGAMPRGKALSRFLFQLFGVFIADAGEMVELLYQFEEPLVLDGSKFAQAFPSFSYTAHEDAVSKTLEWFREWSVR